ncbi:MAG: hypothetical protein ACTS3T_23795 [Almyronema sp.]
MSALTQRLSTAEISQRILDMAITGVYRESVFETFRPVATQKQIRGAIAHAKQLGLHSVPQLRDQALGTYYQIDAGSYETAQALLKAEVTFAVGASPTAQLLLTTQTLKAMLGVSVSIAVLCALGGALLWLNGQFVGGTSALVASLSAWTIWMIQNRLAQKFM